MSLFCCSSCSVCVHVSAGGIESLMQCFVMLVAGSALPYQSPSFPMQDGGAAAAGSGNQGAPAPRGGRAARRRRGGGGGAQGAAAVVAIMVGRSGSGSDSGVAVAGVMGQSQSPLCGVDALSLPACLPALPARSRRRARGTSSPTTTRGAGATPSCGPVPRVAGGWAPGWAAYTAGGLAGVPALSTM